MTIYKIIVDMSSRNSNRILPKPMFGLKSTLKQQYQIICSYSTSCSEQQMRVQIDHLKQFQERLSKQIQKQGVQKISNSKIIKNLQVQLHKGSEIGFKTLSEIQKQRKQVQNSIAEYKKQIKNMSLKEGQVQQQSSKDSINTEYQYQLEMRKNKQYKRKLQELEKTNQNMKSLPSIHNSRSKPKKELEVLQFISITKSKAQKNQQVYLGNISSKQSKIVNLEKNSVELDRSILEVEQQIQEMKLIGV